MNTPHDSYYPPAGQGWSHQAGGQSGAPMGPSVGLHGNQEVVYLVDSKELTGTRIAVPLAGAIIPAVMLVICLGALLLPAVNEVAWIALLLLAASALCVALVVRGWSRLHFAVAANAQIAANRIIKQDL